MCGIYCSISRGSQIHIKTDTQELLSARGPDSVQELFVSLRSSNSRSSGTEPFNINVLSTVLALRGDQIQPQPLRDGDDQSFLCWNGEAWKHNGQVIGGGDSQYMFNLLLQACRNSLDPSRENVIHALTSIAGPFAFVFYDAVSSHLFYGRDHLGRRSLLSQTVSDGGMVLCSITDGPPSSNWEEVETSGLHFVDLSNSSVAPELSPWPNNLPRINASLPDSQIPALGISSEALVELGRRLHESVRVRIADIPNLGQVNENRNAEDANVAILFSGGLDCTLLARLAHDILPLDEPVDLLNVAFENPRSMAAVSKTDTVVSPYESCPDRKTGRSSYVELRRVCSGRKWRFIGIDIPYEESESHQATIVGLMAPHNTEMDLSIAKALYFAARGRGQIRDNKTNTNSTFSTRARVLLSGLGADELFGGYKRHETACARQGYPGLINELDIDIRRLGQRNLGRDDRIISHWAREVRYPYLDEDFVRWTLGLPVWYKCGFAPHGVIFLEGNDISAKCLDPAKQALRYLALRLGMAQVANERKRAIQFGSRTAKMQVGKGRNRGTDLIC